MSRSLFDENLDLLKETVVKFTATDATPKALRLLAAEAVARSILHFVLQLFLSGAIINVHCLTFFGGF